MLLLAMPLAHLAFLTEKLWQHSLMFAGFKRVAPEHAIGMELEEPFLTALELFQQAKDKPHSPPQS